MDTGTGSNQSCTSCTRDASTSRFDLCVSDLDGHERLFFGILATFCRWCESFVIDREAARLLGVSDRDVISAIRSDACLTGNRG